MEKPKLNHFHTYTEICDYVTAAQKEFSDIMTLDELAHTQEGRVIWVCDDLPRSFVVTDNGSENWQVYVSQLSSATLMGRAERNSFE